MAARPSHAAKYTWPVGRGLVTGQTNGGIGAGTRPLAAGIRQVTLAVANKGPLGGRPQQGTYVGDNAQPKVGPRLGRP